MFEWLTRARQALVIVVAFSGTVASAHEDIPPTDPGILFERLIAEGFKTSRAEQVTLAGDALRFARSIFNRTALWTNKSRLRVCFWNGSATERSAVAKSALRWNGAAKISLSIEDGSGLTVLCPNDWKAFDIRVSLSPDPALKYEAGQKPTGNWSLIGKQSEFVPIGQADGSRYQVTLNMPTIPADLLIGNDNEVDFTVGHEFGHALGLLHEFQSGLCKGWIDIDQLAADQGWGGEAVQNLEPLPNLSGPLKIDFGLAGAYDLQSIMQYNLSVKYYREEPGKVNPCKRLKDVSAPSPDDIKTLGAMYGKPVSGSLPGIAENAIEDTRRDLLALRKIHNFVKSASPVDLNATTKTLKAIERLDNFAKGIVDK